MIIFDAQAPINMINLHRFILIVFSIATISACQPDQLLRKNQLIVRLESEPDRLNPVLSRGGTASQIENHLFQPLAELDPLSLKFTPVLLEKISKTAMDSIEIHGTVERLDLHIKQDAVWPDKTPVTYRDILFTLKTMLNDNVGVARKKNYFSFVKAEKHDVNDPKFLSIYSDTAAYDADKIVMNFHIMPQHIYDSLGLMDDITLDQLIRYELSQDDLIKLEKFATLFTDEKFSRTVVSGSGAYELDYWNTGYEIKLKRKQDWWGTKYGAANLFKALPDEIIYKIIPDQQLAVTAMANGNVDIIADVTPEKFNVLKKSSASQYQFLTPVIPRYYSIILNNESHLLSNVRVRQAMAHLVDQPKMIEVVMGGYGHEVTAPFLPSYSGYDPSIKPYPFDVAKATALLEEAGWTDTDDDGIADQEIDGKKVDLRLRLFITGSQLGRQIALLLKDNFEKAGIEIIIESKKFSSSMQAMRSGDFEMVATAPTHPLHDPVLKPAWHSNSIGRGGGNLARFSNEVVDRLLEQLTTEENLTRRQKLYRQFHYKIHEEAPVLFLLMPTERILVNNDWHVDPSTRRPGYFENMAFLKENRNEK